ncbi:unnamed protein product, partial [Polarella glacialis]
MQASTLCGPAKRSNARPRSSLGTRTPRSLPVPMPPPTRLAPHCWADWAPRLESVELGLEARRRPASAAAEEAAYFGASEAAHKPLLCSNNNSKNNNSNSNNNNDNSRSNSKDSNRRPIRPASQGGHRPDSKDQVIFLPPHGTNNNTNTNTNNNNHNNNHTSNNDNNDNSNNNHNNHNNNNKGPVQPAPQGEDEPHQDHVGRSLAISKPGAALQQPQQEKQQQGSAPEQADPAVATSRRQMANLRRQSMNASDYVDQLIARDLVEGHKVHNRQVRSRIRAFDRRSKEHIAAAQSPAPAVVASKAKGTDSRFAPKEKCEPEPCTGVANADKQAVHMPAAGTTISGRSPVSPKTPQFREEEEVRFKLVGCSSERHTCPAACLTSQRHCWQTTVGKVSRQHVTLELLGEPRSMSSLNLSLVLAEASPK